MLLSIKRVCGPALAGVVQSTGLRTKAHWFDSQSGHMPGLQARSPLGGVPKTPDQCFFHTSVCLSLSFSLPSPLKIKIKKILFKKFALHSSREPENKPGMESKTRLLLSSIPKAGQERQQFIPHSSSFQGRASELRLGLEGTWLWWHSHLVGEPRPRPQ